jgi:hypothetical protein
MMGDAGRGLHQRTVEELVKSELRLDGRPGRGGEPEPPPRLRTWSGAAGLLALLGAAILLVLAGDCAGPGGPTEASPLPSQAAYSPMGSTDQPPSIVMV